MTGVPIQTKGMPNISELLQIVVEPIIFKEKSVIENVDPTSLQLIPKSTEFKFEQGLLCLQRAELASDCRRCIGASVPQKFSEKIITSAELPHLDYTKKG